MADYNEFVNEDARLTVLKELTQQVDGRLNEKILIQVLDTFGHNKSREWLRTQLNKMADLGAIRIHKAGTVFVAEITRAGVDHVERRSVIEGIAKPSLGG